MRHKQCKWVVLSALCASLLGCSAPSQQLESDADTVHVRFDSGFNAEDCFWLGEVTGSEGHWYSYWFYPNDVLIQGAVNEIKNRAKKLGADTVYMISPQDFTTSFTVVGNAYQCHGNDEI
ncbi:DUF4156 domain-containing protein [Vibrio renipiscarius]|uniref:Membrane protein n=1 Tax=Vibrio renipiscarius TaxID=1461322 RepID=A0A0C2JFS7_9VIBR|nr:DUF4156 domain-containing protein [Vibrio renipiscarius]KII76809.1 membrane protein [Vibrio renipiscarius]KII76937.1 membrane protein [Vibrio renipiscarius]